MKLSKYIYKVLAVPAVLMAAACGTDVLMDEHKNGHQEVTPYAIEFSESVINSSVRSTYKPFVSVKPSTRT